MTERPQKLERLDPISNEALPDLAAIILEEISVRIAAGDFDSSRPETLNLACDLAADAIVQGYQVRKRTPETPRYRWVDDNERK